MVWLTADHCEDRYHDVSDAEIVTLVRSNEQEEDGQAHRREGERQ